MVRVVIISQAVGSMASQRGSLRWNTNWRPTQILENKPLTPESMPTRPEKRMTSAGWPPKLPHPSSKMDELEKRPGKKSLVACKTRLFCKPKGGLQTGLQTAWDKHLFHFSNKQGLDPQMWTKPIGCQWPLKKLWVGWPYYPSLQTGLTGLQIGLHFSGHMGMP